MSADDTKLNYLSTWDIDQLYATNTVVLALVTNPIYTIPADIPGIPVFEVQLKPIGSTKWYQSGSFTLSNTLATQRYFYTYVEAGVLYITTTVIGTARYFVWTDKVNY